MACSSHHHTGAGNPVHFHGLFLQSCPIVIMLARETGLFGKYFVRGDDRPYKAVRALGKARADP